MRAICVFLLGICVVAFGQETKAPAAAPNRPKTGDKSGPEGISADVLKGFETYWTEEQAAPPEPDALSLDVRKCVDLALAQNAQVQVAQDQVDAAKAKIGQARAGRMPQVKATEGVVDVTGLKAMGGPLGGLFGSLQGESVRRQDNVKITQVLFAGGQITAAIRASEYLAQSQEWQKEAKLDDLEFQAKSAYFACLLARAMVRVADESVVTFKRHLGDAQQMLDVGLISNFEVLRAKTEVGAREADSVAAKNATRLALVNLRRILALPEAKPLLLVGTLEWTPIKESIDDLVREAQEKRPELLALQKGIDAAGQNVKRTKGQYLPRAAASADWMSTDGGGMSMPDGWTFSVGAEWDLYTGGKRKHEVAEAKAQRSGLEHQLDDVKRLIEMDVRAAHIQMQDAAARIRQEKGTVELAREGRRLAMLRFEEGVGTQTETLDAELALTNAETMLVKVLHDCAVAHAAIEKATGRSWVKREPPDVK